MKRAFIGLGANLGPSLETLKQAALQLAEHPLISAFQLSPLYKSKPVDSQGPDYVNAVASLRTSLEPVALLGLLQEMEQAYGRQRPYRNAPRTLDLDLLLYEGVKLNTDILTVPHPRMHLRACSPCTTWSLSSPWIKVAWRRCLKHAATRKSNDCRKALSTALYQAGKMAISAMRACHSLGPV